MDGYSFMIERNRLLIQHEANVRALREGGGTAPQALSDADGSLAAAVRRLYDQLQGCGRRGDGEGTGSQQ